MSTPDNPRLIDPYAPIGHVHFKVGHLEHSLCKPSSYMMAVSCSTTRLFYLPITLIAILTISGRIALGTEARNLRAHAAEADCLVWG